MGRGGGVARGEKEMEDGREARGLRRAMVHGKKFENAMLHTGN